MKYKVINLEMIKTLEFPLNWKKDNSFEIFDIQENAVEDDLPLFKILNLVLRTCKEIEKEAKNNQTIQTFLIELEKYKQDLNEIITEKRYVIYFF